MSSLPPAGVEMDLQSFIAQQSRLLSAERAEDVNNAGTAISQLSEKQLIAAGLALHKLLISDSHNGLYGRCLLTFVPASGELLPASQISVRDIVRIQPKQQQSATSAQPAFGQSTQQPASSPTLRSYPSLTPRSAPTCVRPCLVDVAAQTMASSTASPTSPSSSQWRTTRTPSSGWDSSVSPASPTRSCTSATRRH